MAQNQTLPLLWLLSDARNDAGLENALSALPKGSGFIYRHYHLDRDERQKRYADLYRHAKKFTHLVILSGDPLTAHKWSADGIYGAPANIGADMGANMDGYEGLKLMTAHNEAEIAAADHAGADAILLSPVFATNSHPDAKPLGQARFRMLAAKAKAPVIALGGMTRKRAKAMNWPRWAAIDGLTS